MELFWQQIIIGVLVVGAVGYLVWHFVRKGRRKNACENCAVMKAAKKQIEDRSPSR